MADNDFDTSISKPVRKHYSLDGAVSFAKIIGIAVAFVAGIVATLLYQNMLSKEPIQFDTVNLLNFMFGISLAGAAVVLAIVAIALSKSSEQVMIDRSDKSIQLQNEVFQKTTEVLSQIRSSTGTTEKRIEDMIHGNIHVISKEAAQQVSVQLGPDIKDKPNTRVMAQAIEQSLRGALDINFPHRNTGEAARFRAFTNEVQVALANYPNGTIQAIQTGNLSAEGDEMYDGIIKVKDLRVAVATLLIDAQTSYYLENETDLPSLIEQQLTSSEYDRILLLTFHRLATEPALQRALLRVKRKHQGRLIIIDDVRNGPRAALYDALDSL
jgi:hypothetical protein